MGRPKQLSFIKPSLRQFGGSLLKGNPKEKRPLPNKGSLHLVLKSKRAFGGRSMLAPPHVNRIDQLVRKQAETCGVKIYHFVNVGNHLHLVVGIKNRALYRAFIRSVSGLIARLVLKKERGPKSPEKSRAEEEIAFSKRETDKLKRETDKLTFWVARPFTRLVTWGRDYENLTKYMQKNRNQAKRFGIRVSEKLGDSVPGFDNKQQGSVLNTA